jgi:hypothetical protein
MEGLDVAAGLAAVLMGLRGKQQPDLMVCFWFFGF